MERGPFRWRKSSYSGGNNDCVEVAFTGDEALVRDSKNPDGGMLTLSARQWRQLLAAIARGELGAL